MSDDLTSLVQRLAATTGASTNDILNAVATLNEDNAALPEPWSEETITRALPSLVEMAARGRTSVRAVAAGVRAMAVQVRPDEEPAT